MSNYGIPNMTIYGYAPPEKASVPLNSLILWYGIASAVPTGWTIYSTAGGNLIMGASAGAKTTTPAGANTHVHTNSATSSGGSHDHSGGSGSVGGGSGQDAFGSTATVASSGHTHSWSNNPTAGGAHTHNVSDSNSASSLPSYHRLYWIERTA